MNNLSISEVLQKHSLWFNGEGGGERADLSRANLYGASLSKANLSKANLSEASLSGADLSEADLSGANLSEADLSRANLYGADLSGADLSKANLSEANLSGAGLSGANLSEADLSRANLYGADLSGAGIACIQNLGGYFVQIDKQFIRIGCQRHEVATWKSFTPRDIAKMASNATAWWRTYKKVVFALHGSLGRS